MWFQCRLPFILHSQHKYFGIRVLYSFVSHIVELSNSYVYRFMVTIQDEDNMTSALVNQGPLSVLINAELLQFYHSGVWDPIVKCDPKELDHGMCIESGRPAPPLCEGTRLL